MLPVPTLLARTGLPSLNKLAAKAVALETWKAVVSSDGPDSSQNPLGILLGLPGAGGRLTRQSAARQLPTPLAGNKDSLASIGHKVWNTYAPLREAKTLSEARKAAKTFSMTVPAEMHKS